jgi:hypothetical protein
MGPDRLPHCPFTPIGHTVGAVVEHLRFTFRGTGSVPLDERDPVIKYQTTGHLKTLETVTPSSSLPTRCGYRGISAGMAYPPLTFGLAMALAGTFPPAAFAQAQSTTVPASAATDGGFFGRLVQAYEDDFNRTLADPDAPPTRRPAPYPAQPLTSPPYPYADWTFGGSEVIGASLPNQVDSPLTTALWGGAGGQTLKDAGIQIYGWLNPGANVSTSSFRKNGNAPGGYDFAPNSVVLDQAALYVERVPDTVQRDHLDWGFRVSSLYGTDYRYVTARGVLSDQLLVRDRRYGLDFPMFYGEIYLPRVAQGMMIRVGRSISLPDIEAQLAPDNYMYSHSLLYTFDPFTIFGITASVQLTNNWMVQATLSSGNDIAPWVRHDPGAQPSATLCLRWNSEDSYNNVYACANNFNNGRWGYNNMQQPVVTYYHKFNEKWHVAWESYNMYQRDTPNSLNPNQPMGLPYPGYPAVNGPSGAYCSRAAYCTSKEYATLAYLNYQFAPMDNLTFRGEFFNDLNGQRTGFKTPYVETSVGVQHWFSPTIVMRPELTFYHATKATPFNNGAKRSEFIAATDLVWHF